MSSMLITVNDRYSAVILSDVVILSESEGSVTSGRGSSLSLRMTNEGTPDISRDIMK